MAYISAADAVYNALKPLVNGAVWPFFRPADQNAVPYIVFSPVNSNPLTTVEGWTGENQVRMQIEVHHETFKQADDLAKEIIPVIDALTTVTASVQDGIVNDRDVNTGLFSSLVEFLIWEKVL